MYSVQNQACAHAQGWSFCMSVGGTKIARSRDIGIWTRKRNEKLAAREQHKQCILLATPIDLTYVYMYMYSSTAGVPCACVPS